MPVTLAQGIDGQTVISFDSHAMLSLSTRFHHTFGEWAHPGPIDVREAPNALVTETTLAAVTSQHSTKLPVKRLVGTERKTPTNA